MAHFIDWIPYTTAAFGTSVMGNRLELKSNTVMPIEEVQVLEASTLSTELNTTTIVVK